MNSVPPDSSAMSNQISSDALSPDPFQAARAARLLLGHRRIEAGAIDAEALRAQRILGQVIGKAERVVELERGLAGQRRRPSPCPAVASSSSLQAVVERLAEAGFLLQQRLLDQRLRADQFGIGGAHLGDQRRHQPVHQRLLRAEQMRVAHRAAHDPAQHIAAALVGRQHAVGDQEARRAQMIGDHAVAGLRCRPSVAVRGQRARCGDQRLERVGIVIVVDALQHRGDALQPHAGVDRRACGRSPTISSASCSILHEDEVPDLDEAVAILVRAAGRAAGDMVAMIVEDFRARPARPGVAHRPEIVLGRRCG